MFDGAFPDPIAERMRRSPITPTVEHKTFPVQYAGHIGRREYARSIAAVEMRADWNEQMVSVTAGLREDHKKVRPPRIMLRPRIRHDEDMFYLRVIRRPDFPAALVNSKIRSLSASSH